MRKYLILAFLFLFVFSYSTLYAEDNNCSDLQRTMEVKNPEGELSMLSFIAGNKAFIKIFSGISVADTTRFWNDRIWLRENTKIRDINLFINSPGGEAFQGLSIADEIERAKHDGFKITAYASGIIASAAVPIFAVCDLRIAAPGTMFMVHQAAVWKWPGRETESDIQSQNDMMQLLKTRYMNILEKYTKLKSEKWCDLVEKRATWFTADKAKDWGLVDRIE